MTKHLSEEAVLRWQMGDVTEEERMHLAGCPECQARTAPLADALQWFGAAAREWGTERAAALPLRAARPSAFTTTPHWRPLLAGLAVTCTVLLLVFGIALPHWRAHRAELAALALHQRQIEQQQELASDNALLEAVDQDVSQVIPEAMQPLSGTAETGGSTSTTRQ